MDPAFESSVPVDVSQNQASYDPASVDYQLLLKNTQAYRLVSGISLNDSRMGRCKVHLLASVGNSAESGVWKC